MNAHTNNTVLGVKEPRQDRTNELNLTNSNPNIISQLAVWSKFYTQLDFKSFENSVGGGGEAK